jgi:arylsulfatase A-like enzyme
MPLAWKERAAAQSAGPNIVLIVTDDMQASDLEAMPRTRDLIGGYGTTFPYLFSSTPLCTPSRVSLLTGQFAHNHGVLGNSAETGGYPRYAGLGLGSRSIQMPLRAAGYRTALIGKFMNGIPEAGEVAPGWDHLFALLGHQHRGFRVNENGAASRARQKDFTTPALSKEAVSFITGTPAGQPFFLHLSPIAPHNIPRYPEALARKFLNARIPRTPDLNEDDVSDKPAYLRGRSRFKRRRLRFLGEHHRGRLRSLLMVDDMVADVVAALEETGRLGNTYIFFLSDNGMLIGHHRHVGKTLPYDRGARTPLLARGPGFVPGTVDGRLALNIDVTATITAVSGISLPDLDGVSLLDPPARSDLLLEWLGAPEPPDTFYSPTAPRYSALRTGNRLYVEYETGERELYNYDDDRYELNNLLATFDGRVPSPDAEAQAQQFQTRLAALRSCSGAACR